MVTSTTEPPTQYPLAESGSYDPTSGRRASLFIEDSDPVFLPQPRRSSSRDTSAKAADIVLPPYFRSPADGSDRSFFLRQSYNSPGSSPASTDSQRRSIDMGGTNRISSPSTSGEASPTSLKIDTTWAPVRASSAHRDASRSPNPLDFQDVRRASGRVGALGLATMHEESDHSTSQREPLHSARPSYLTSEPDSNFRPSRHRSSSSAAALALHGTGSAFTDRWSSNPAGRIASAVPSRAAWDRDILSNEAAALPSAGGPRQQPHLQRGFSASYVGYQLGSASPSPLVSSPGGFYEATHDHPSQPPHQNLRTASSPYAPSIEFSNLSSYPGAESEGHQRTFSGFDSRRHSVAGPNPYDSTGIIGDHRRALGFDVEPRSSLGRSQTGGSDLLSRDMPRRAFSSFSGDRSLAFSVDDLTGGYDHLQSDVDRSKGQDQRNRAMSPPTHVRVPMEQSATSRTHAASMPSAFNGGGLDTYTPSSSAAADALRSNGGRTGFDSLSASWDVLLSPAHQSVALHHSQQELADVSRQLRHMSIGAADPRPSVRRASVFEEHKEGTETVRASPGTSPIGSRTDPGRFALSAQAKSFDAALPTPPQSASRDHEFLQAERQNAFSASGMASMMQLGQPPAPLPYGMPRPQPADLAFSSLAALGPLPPSSMGPAPFGQGSQGELQDLGKGVSLSSLSRDTNLYIVEFKQGRTDLFFRATSPGASPAERSREAIHRGDLVIVEADRGKDLGTVVNDSITVEQVQAFLSHQSDFPIGSSASMRSDPATEAGLGISPSSSLSSGGAAIGSLPRPMRSINPKRLFTKATAANTSTLYSKAQDEERALQLCTAKVNQRGLPMTVVAAEMQWDRRKLTFYYTASTRVDFRDLVKELFRLYKTRIWMCHLGHPSGTGMG